MLQLFSHKDCQFYKVQFKTAEENRRKILQVISSSYGDSNLGSVLSVFFAIISVVHCHNVCRVIDKDTKLTSVFLQYQYFFLLEHRFVIIITDQSKHKAIG